MSNKYVFNRHIKKSCSVLRCGVGSGNYVHNKRKANYSLVKQSDSPTSVIVGDDYICVSDSVISVSD